MKLLFTFLCLSFVLDVNAQDHQLSAFENLVGKTWIVEGTWGNGSLYKKESVFEFALNRTLVIEKSKGFTDSLQTTFGDRNYGVRQFNPEDSTITFYEFDVFGKITEGDVIIHDKNIGYTYEYEGFNLIDMWMYVDENNYRFVVAPYENGKIGEQYFLDGKATVKTP